MADASGSDTFLSEINFFYCAVFLLINLYGTVKPFLWHELEYIN